MQGCPDPREAYQASSEACKVLVKSLMEGKQCVHQAGATARKERIEEEKAYVEKMKEGRAKPW